MDYWILRIVGLKMLAHFCFMDVKKKKIQFSHSGSTYLRYLFNPNASKSLLILPALGVPASYYDKLLHALFENGFSAASVDLHGQGDSSVKAGTKQDFGYVDMLEKDTPLAVYHTKHIFNQP